MRNSTLLLLLFLVVFWTVTVNATNYYFSSINGDDNNSGLSSSEPKASVNEIRSTVSSLVAGDTIFFERGSKWEQAYIIAPALSGTADEPIVFDVYGEGENPVFSGQTTLTSPTQDGNIYTFTGADIPFVVLKSKSYGKRFLGYVTLDGKPYLPSRHPNKGYYKSTSSNRISVTDNNKSWTTDQWKDGWLAMKSRNWQWSDVKVTSNSDVKVNTTDHEPYSPFGPKPYFFINAYNALDLDGEWYWTTNQFSVYWSGDQLPEVKVSSVDQVLYLNNSDYVHVNNIDFVGANYYCVKILKSNHNTFNRCRFIGAGEFGVYIFGASSQPNPNGESADNTIQYCEIADCGLGGIFSRYAGAGHFTNNYLHRIAINPGYQNKSEDNSTDGYAIAVWNNLVNEPVIKQNFMDSVQAGVTNHYNASSFVMEENFIRNYGMGDLSDLGGYYVVSDTYNLLKKKKVYKNFFVDVHEPDSTAQTTLYSDSYIHAVYFDQDSYSVRGDSNSIENSQIAWLTNGGKWRSFSYNNILHPLTHNSIIKEHRATMVNAYVIALNGGSKPEGDTVIHNNVVYGDLGEVGYKFARNSSTYGCKLSLKGRVDYNKWFDPLGTSPYVASIYNGYAPETDYRLSAWQALEEDCDGVHNDPGDNSTYNDTAYDEVRLLKNWSADEREFLLDAEYVDVDGNAISGSTMVPAFYSKLIFKVSGTETQSDIYIDSTLIPEPVAVAPAEIVVSSNQIADKTSGIRCFPVPVRDYLNVQNVPGGSVISVFDILGNKTIERSIISNESVSINMSNLKSGVYLIQIIHHSSVIESFKIIKR